MKKSKMSSSEKRALKGKDKETEQTEEDLVDKRLPPRLFAPDRFPSKRLNCNSTLDYLLLVKDALEGTDEFEQLLASCFGHLFRLPVRRCAFSGKIVHGMLTRQLVTKKRYELWPVFGGQPLKRVNEQKKRKSTVLLTAAEVENERLPTRLFATEVPKQEE